MDTFACVAFPRTIRAGTDLSETVDSGEDAGHDNKQDGKSLLA